MNWISSLLPLSFLYDLGVKILIALVSASLIALLAASRTTVVNYINNRFFSNLRKYQGDYFGYRWYINDEGVASLVEPTISIKRRWFGAPYRFHWTTPQGMTAGYDVVQTQGREIYAYGKNRDLGSYTSIVIHPAHTNPVDVLSGTYLFMDMTHRIVSGSFLMSREKLTREQVEELMRPAVTISDQRKSFNIAMKLIEMKKGSSATIIELQPNATKSQS